MFRNKIVYNNKTEQTYIGITTACTTSLFIFMEDKPIQYNYKVLIEIVCNDVA